MDLLNLGKHLFFNTSQTENGVTLATIAVDFKSATEHSVDYLCRDHLPLPPTKRGPKFGTWTRVVSFEQMLQTAAKKHGNVELTICYPDSFIIDYCNRFKGNPWTRVNSNAVEFERIFKSVMPNYSFIKRTGEKRDHGYGVKKIDNPCPLATLSKMYAELSIENASRFENEDRRIKIAALAAFQRDELIQSMVPDHLW